MNQMSYRSYFAHIEYDEVDRIFVGHLAGLQDIVGFHGTSVDELEQAFHEAVESYLAISEESGRAAQKPYTEPLILTISPETHAAVATLSHRQGKSIQQWATEAISRAATL